MKKTDAKAAPLAAFNPKATRAVAAYMDVTRMVLDGNIAALKAASMLRIDLSKPCSTQTSPRSKPYQSLPVILAMEADRKDVFDFLVTGQRASLNVKSNYLHGPASLSSPAGGAPLDAAYNLKRFNAPNAAYYFEQLVANGARLTIGKHAADIKKTVASMTRSAAKAAPASPK